ncbi:MAG: hypothetical protein M1829_005942 [Trizodia sp. TS-e1964]|nr:MAG: hypothetical protein M1829_005942 [Trizodia sp. TS-e1964]
MGTTAETAIAELITSYSELNSTTIDEFTEAPSALEFMRYVARNRPFVVRSGAAHWAATRLWTAEYLEEAMADQRVNVAVTPHGFAPPQLYYAPCTSLTGLKISSNADSVVTGADGALVFVRPLEQEELFRDFFYYVRNQELGCGGDVLDLVKYAQTQNDNLRGEYAEIFKDVEKDIPWARIALATEPEAINVWIGNSRSVTALHKDNYENIYCQLVGSKNFVLLPPAESACVGERELRCATYVYADTKGSMKVKEDEPLETIPFATWDPDKPSERSTRFSHFSQPHRVTLGPGDMLYLPAMWLIDPISFD